MPLIPPDMPLSMVPPGLRRLARALPTRVVVTKAAIAGQHVRHAVLDRAISAIPVYRAGSGRYHRAPGGIAHLGCRWIPAIGRNGKDHSGGVNDAFHLQPHRLLMIVTPDSP